MVEAGRRGDDSLAADGVDVRKRRKRIDQRIAGEDGRGAQLSEDRLGPPAGMKLPCSSV